MLGRLARNTAYSALAFGVNGAVALALVPVIVHAYGLALYGALILARAFLPAGALGLLDFGMAETATQAVGRARGSGAWQAASEQLAVLLALGVTLGVGIGVALGVAAPFLAAAFDVPSPSQPGFVSVLRATAACLPLLFPGLVAEGVIKGLERFGALRAVEVAATAAYAAGTLVSISSHTSFTAVAYAYLGAMTVRAACLAVLAGRHLHRAGLRLRKWGAQPRAEVLRRSRLMFHSKLLGALQMPVPPLLIGALVGPDGVGLYDVVTRLPRFLKSTLSLLASAVMPVAARLEGRGAVGQLRALGEKSFSLIPYLTFPLLFATAGLSRSILELWVGPELAQHWPWMAAMLLFPVLAMCLTFSQAMLQVRADYIASANRISTVGVALQLLLSIGLVHVLGAMAFVLGISLSWAAVFPLHLRLVARHLDAGVRALARPLVKMAAAGLAIAVALAAASGAMARPGIGPVSGAFVLGLALFWLAAYGLILEDNARRLLWRLAASLAGGGKNDVELGKRMEP